MLRIRRILRDYEDAGSLNSLIALWGFVDDHTFLTKAGHLGVVYRLAGVDFECLDHAQRRDVVHRYEAALRCLDESCRVYQYLSKRRMPPIAPAPCRQPRGPRSRPSSRGIPERTPRRPFRARPAPGAGLRRTSAASLRQNVVLRDLWTDPRAAFRQWLSPSATLALVEADIDRAVAHLHQKADAFEVQLADSVRAHAPAQDRRLPVLPTPRELHARAWSRARRSSTTRTLTTSSPTAGSTAIATTWSSTRRG